MEEDRALNLIVSALPTTLLDFVPNTLKIVLARRSYRRTFTRPLSSTLLSFQISLSVSSKPTFAMEAARDGDGAPLITALGNEKPKARRRSPVPDLHSSRPIYRTRLTLRILSTAMCFVIIGVLIDAVRTYHATKHVTEGWSNGNGRFEVWPTSLSMKSTNTLLGAAAVGAALSLALTLASCVSSVCLSVKGR